MKEAALGGSIHALAASHKLQRHQNSEINTKCMYRCTDVQMHRCVYPRTKCHETLACAAGALAHVQFKDEPSSRACLHERLCATFARAKLQHTLHRFEKYAMRDDPAQAFTGG